MQIHFEDGLARDVAKGMVEMGDGTRRDVCTRWASGVHRARCRSRRRLRLAVLAVIAQRMSFALLLKVSRHESASIRS
jgi:hypothetical protein